MNWIIESIIHLYVHKGKGHAINSMVYDDTEYGIWWYGVWNMMIRSMWYDDLEYGIWWYEAQQKMHHLLSDSSSWTSSFLFCSCSSWIEDFSVSICSMLSSNLDDRWSVKSLTTRDKFEVPSESLIPWYGMMLRDYDTGCVAMIWNEDTGWWYEMMIRDIG